VDAPQWAQHTHTRTHTHTHTQRAHHSRHGGMMLAKRGVCRMHALHGWRSRDGHQQRCYSTAKTSQKLHTQVNASVRMQHTGCDMCATRPYTGGWVPASPGDVRRARAHTHARTHTGTSWGRSHDSKLPSGVYELRAVGTCMHMRSGRAAQSVTCCTRTQTHSRAQFQGVRRARTHARTPCTCTCTHTTPAGECTAACWGCLRPAR
jgi:hypothetical protein